MAYLDASVILLFASLPTYGTPRCLSYPSICLQSEKRSLWLPSYASLLGNELTDDSRIQPPFLSERQNVFNSALLFASLPAYGMP